MQTDPSSDVSSDGAHDRRIQPRFLASDLCAQLRIKGQFGRLAIDVLDFNRHGFDFRFNEKHPGRTYIATTDGGQGIHSLNA